MESSIFNCSPFNSMIPVRIGITDATTPDDLDRYFEQTWKQFCGQKINFVFDVRQCRRRVSLRRLLGMRSVLNKHRVNCRTHVDHSKIIVSSRATKNILRMGLAIMRTERPVKVIKM